MEAKDGASVVAATWMSSSLVAFVVVEASPQRRLIPNAERVRADSNDAELLSRAAQLIAIEEEIDASLRPGDLAGAIPEVAEAPD